MCDTNNILNAANTIIYSVQSIGVLRYYERTIRVRRVTIILHRKLYQVDLH